MIILGICHAGPTAPPKPSCVMSEAISRGLASRASESRLSFTIAMLRPHHSIGSQVFVMRESQLRSISK